MRSVPSPGLEAQNIWFERASIYMDTVREFVDKPGNILGSPATKHGEIAEVAEVGLRSAWDILNGVDPTASLHPDRIGPVDYIVQRRRPVQVLLRGAQHLLGCN